MISDNNNNKGKAQLNEMTPLQKFAHENLGGIYDPRVEEHEQCRGWRALLSIHAGDGEPKPEDLNCLHPIVRKAIMANLGQFRRIKHNSPLNNSL